MNASVPNSKTGKTQLLAWHKVMLLAASLFIICAAASAQTYTITSPSPQILTINNVHAGDQVTVDATLFSGDPNENGEGEPLVVVIPGGNFVISTYFNPGQTTFLALQDGQTVSAFIQGADGDESATVTFTVNAKKRYTQEEKDKFAKYAAILGGVGGVSGTVAGLCGLAPDVTVTKICAIVGALGAGAAAILAARYGVMAADPFDPNFTTVFQPVLLTLPTVVVQPGVTQAEADAANAYFLNLAEQAELTQAIQISINRANSASSVGDTTDETMQMQAAANFATQLAGFVTSAASIRATLVSAIQAAGFTPVTAGPGDVFNYESSIIFFGLPSDTLNAMTSLGADANEVAFATGILTVQDINATAGTFPDFLNSTTQSTTEQDIATALINFAGRNGGGVPLTPGQQVQAQGNIMQNGAAQTTFAMEAHVTPQGLLLGKLEMNDHSGFNITHGPVTHAFTTGPTSFLVNGTYTATDRSSQTWSISGDTASQSVTLSTSQGFSVTGVLTGGNVSLH